MLFEFIGCFERSRRRSPGSFSVPASVGTHKEDSKKHLGANAKHSYKREAPCVAQFLLAASQPRMRDDD